jgi:hypothetical protein
MATREFCCAAVSSLRPISQIHLLDLRVGLLINFHEIVLKDGIKRMVNNYCGNGTNECKRLKP